MALFTASYWAIDPSRLVPVRTTVGKPRLDFPYAELLAAAPWGFLEVKDHERFAREYSASLDRRADRILRDLGAIQDSYPGWDLALACYCWQRPDLCHRRVLATWLEERLGVTVPELG